MKKQQYYIWLNDLISIKIVYLTKIKKINNFQVFKHEVLLFSFTLLASVIKALSLKDALSLLKCTLANCFMTPGFQTSHVTILYYHNPDYLTNRQRKWISGLKNTASSVPEQSPCKSQGMSQHWLFYTVWWTYVEGKKECFLGNRFSRKKKQTPKAST